MRIARLPMKKSRSRRRCPRVTEGVDVRKVQGGYKVVPGHDVLRRWLTYFNHGGRDRVSEWAQATHTVYPTRRQARRGSRVFAFLTKTKF